MTSTLLKTCKGLWFPISELKDKYNPTLMIASPKLIDLDFNTEGASPGYWQDDEGWIALGWCGCHDEPTKVVLTETDVTHFMYVEGPYVKNTELVKAQVEEAARKFALDHGYVYYDGVGGRPDNWDRGRILRRGGTEDTLKASDPSWYWAENENISSWDVIGIRTDPANSSEDMTLQGLYSWLLDSEFDINFCGVKSGQTEWLVNYEQTYHVVSGDLRDVLVKIRDLWIGCLKDDEGDFDKDKLIVAMQDLV